MSLRRIIQVRVNSPRGVALLIGRHLTDGTLHTVICGDDVKEVNILRGTASLVVLDGRAHLAEPPFFEQALDEEMDRALAASRVLHPKGEDAEQRFDERRAGRALALAKGMMPIEGQRGATQYHVKRFYTELGHLFFGLGVSLKHASSDVEREYGPDAAAFLAEVYKNGSCRPWASLAGPIDAEQRADDAAQAAREEADRTSRQLVDSPRTFLGVDGFIETDPGKREAVIANESLSALTQKGQRIVGVRNGGIPLTDAPLASGATMRRDPSRKLTRAEASKIPIVDTVRCLSPGLQSSSEVEFVLAEAAGVDSLTGPGCDRSASEEDHPRRLLRNAGLRCARVYDPRLRVPHLATVHARGHRLPSLHTGILRNPPDP